MVERFFFQSYADRESEFYPNLPSSKGIGFSAEHAQMIGERVLAVTEATGVQPIASDVKGWEKNFSKDLADVHADHMQDTVEDRRSCERSLRRACTWWSCSLVSCPYALDTGELLDFKDVRVQRSGDFLTTSANSSGRSACANYVGSVSRTAGDDCLEWSRLLTADLIETYKEIGVPVRDVEEQRGDSFLFCSHRYQRRSDGSWACWLETWQRMVYESSFSKLNDLGTNTNYRAEIEMMPSCEDKYRILSYFDRRRDLLGAIAGHEQEHESSYEQDPDSGL